MRLYRLAIAGLGAIGLQVARRVDAGDIDGLTLTAVSARLVSHQDLIKLFGGLFICWLGVRIALSPPATRSATASGSGLAKAYGSPLALTLTNPTPILSFVAVFAGLGLAETSGDRLPALLLVLGVFLGSALWWLILSGGVSLLRGKLTPSRLRWVNWVSGGLLIGFGLLALGSLLRNS